MVARPLRLRVDLSNEQLELFQADFAAASDTVLNAAVHAIARGEGAGPHRGYSAFRNAVKWELRRREAGRL